MESIEIMIYYSANLDDILDKVLSNTHIPLGGLVYAGIARLLSEQEQLEHFPNPLVPEESTDFYSCRKVVLSKHTYGCMTKKYGSDIVRAITHATTQMIRIGFELPDSLIKWYQFSLPGSGSGKISKSNNA